MIEVGFPVGDHSPAFFQACHHTRASSCVDGAVIAAVGLAAEWIAVIEGAAPDPFPIAIPIPCLIAQHSREIGPSTFLRRRDAKLTVQKSEAPFEPVFGAASVA
jgi:hypothetical protein